MPFWYAATLALAVAVTFAIGPIGSTPALLALGSSALWAVSIVFSLVGPVPINNRVSAWDPDALPDDWLDQRRRWDHLHSVRVAIILIAFLAEVAACLLARRS
jgi:hypothetical protein